MKLAKVRRISNHMGAAGVGSILASIILFMNTKPEIGYALIGLGVALIIGGFVWRLKTRLDTESRGEKTD